MNRIFICFVAGGNSALYTLLLFVSIFLLSGCGVRSAPPPSYARTTQAKLVKVGYAVQVGAFARVENAATLAENLRLQNINATYFKAADGLYKVRFGSFNDREAARSKALSLRNKMLIEDFYIVSPDQYAINRAQVYGVSYAREEIVRTARSFIGVPYLWGGDSPNTGFDCSGLVAATYHLNGLSLPRSSREQFLVGEPVGLEELAPGDLVFFSNRGEEINHVGIYVGDGKFVHAPGQGKHIREDSLSLDYYSKRFRGGRSYL